MKLLIDYCREIAKLYDTDHTLREMGYSIHDDPRSENLHNIRKTEKEMKTLIIDEYEQEMRRDD